MEHYNHKYAKAKGSMKPEHEPGKELFIDFTGSKLHITNKEENNIISFYGGVTKAIVSLYPII